MPIPPVNKSGGSGAEALRCLKDKAGDPHVIMATLNSYYTTPLRSDIGVDIAEFTPIARMALDTFALWVNPDSGITSVEQFVEALRAKGGAWKMAAFTAERIPAMPDVPTFAELSHDGLL